MTSIAERNRSRLVNTFLAELVRKTGSMVIATKLPDGTLTTLELDADILNKALIKLFESAVRKTFPTDKAERDISETYSDCIKIKSGKLTHIGEGFMNSLIENLVEQAYANKETK